MMDSEDIRREILRSRLGVKMDEASLSAGNHHGYDLDLGLTCNHEENTVQKASSAVTQSQYPVLLLKPEVKKCYDAIHYQSWSSPSYPTTPYAPRSAQLKDNTGPLKLWLLQHKKNPYPTKPEKIMLAILSKMTLTQVSTWFANARRRLKKEYPDEDHVFTEDYGYRKRLQRFGNTEYFNQLSN